MRARPSTLRGILKMLHAHAVDAGLFSFACDARAPLEGPMRIHLSLLPGAALAGLVFIVACSSSNAPSEPRAEGVATTQEALHDAPMVVSRTGLPPGVLPIAPQGKPSGVEAPVPGSCTQLYYGGPVLQRVD